MRANSLQCIRRIKCLNVLPSVGSFSKRVTLQCYGTIRAYHPRRADPERFDDGTRRINRPAGRNNHLVPGSGELADRIVHLRVNVTHNTVPLRDLEAAADPACPAYFVFVINDRAIEVKRDEVPL